MSDGDSKARHATISFEVVEWSEQLRSVTSVWLGGVRRSVQVQLTSRCKSEKMFGVIIILLLILIIITFFYRKLHAVYITIDVCHYLCHKAQTATLHYTREQAD